MLREGNSSAKPIVGSSSEMSNISNFSSQGGFLKQPVFDEQPGKVIGHSSVVSFAMWEKFSCLLSEIAWLAIGKCFAEGKENMDHKASQVWTCYDYKLFNFFAFHFSNMYYLIHLS